MKVVSRCAVLIALALLLCSLPVLAADWTPLGEQMLVAYDGSATIPVAEGAGAFSKLKLDVPQRVLQIGTVKVTFADGQALTVDVNEYVGARRSHVIDLPSAKAVKKIEFTYKGAGPMDAATPGVAKLLGSA